MVGDSSLFILLLLLLLLLDVIVGGAVTWGGGKGNGRMWGLIGGNEGMQGSEGGGWAVGNGAVSQLGGASGGNVTVVPGSKSAGCSSKCSTNVTWKELKIFPFEGSHRW